jgi:hypothetical protein
MTKFIPPSTPKEAIESILSDKDFKNDTYEEKVVAGHQFYNRYAVYLLKEGEKVYIDKKWLHDFEFEKYNHHIGKFFKFLEVISGKYDDYCNLMDEDGSEISFSTEIIRRIDKKEFAKKRIKNL